MPAVVPIIYAAASIGSAYIASRAAGKAADTQERGANEALGLQRDMYNQGREDLAPYRQAGAGAIGTLSGLMGIPMGGGGAAPQGQPLPTEPVQSRSPQAQAFLGARNAHLDQHGRSLSDYRGAMMAGRDAVRAASGRTASSYGGGRSLSDLGGRGRPSGGERMVRMIAPTGEPGEVPEREVPEFERMGARRA